MTEKALIAARRAVRNAKATRCPNSVVPVFAWSLSSDKAYQIACGAWACPYCGRKKRAAAVLVIANGCERAFARGERVRLITLTDGARAQLTVPMMYHSWNRLRTSLKKPPTPALREYAAVLETQMRGALHLHVVATGEYIPQRELSARAARAGFGRVVDIREVHPDAGGRSVLPYYAAKQLATYASKQAANGPASALASKSVVRRRPLRTSRGWGLSLTMAEAMISEAWRSAAQDEDPDMGPWVVLVAHGDGDVSVRAGAAPLALRF
jgi:hypothetical protein